MLLNVRDAKPAEIDFAWPLYRDFVRANIFNGQPGRAPESKWDQQKEQKKFADDWMVDKKYIIEIDEKVIGWVSTKQVGNKLTVENFFVVPEWQNKGIAQKIFEGMIPVWKQENLLVEVSVLKDAPVSIGVESALQRLGFTLTTHDPLSRVMSANWSL